jgi:cortactin
MDKSAFGFEEVKTDKIGTNYSKTKPDVCGAKPVGTFLSRFENCTMNDEETERKIAKQKEMREKKDNEDKKAAVAQVNIRHMYQEH